MDDKEYFVEEIIPYQPVSVWMANKQYIIYSWDSGHKNYLTKVVEGKRELKRFADIESAMYHIEKIYE